jgi:hypothetical protein
MEGAWVPPAERGPLDTSDVSRAKTSTRSVFLQKYPSLEGFCQAKTLKPLFFAACLKKNFKKSLPSLDNMILRCIIDVGSSVIEVILTD